MNFRMDVIAVPSVVQMAAAVADYFVSVLLCQDVRIHRKPKYIHCSYDHSCSFIVLNKLQLPVIIQLLLSTS